MSEVVHDAPRAPQAPVDPNVRVPDAVRRAAAAADAAIAANIAPPAGDPPPAAPVAGDPPPAPAGDPPPAAAPAAGDPPPAPAGDPPPPAGDVADDNDASWRHRFLSMQGRWQQSQRTIGSLQEQLSEMGSELMQAHALIAQNAGQPPAAATPPQPVRLLTPEDEQQYGTELLDVVKRAAQEVVAPDLEAVKSENALLRQKLDKQQRGSVNAYLTEHVPNWRAINDSREWKVWLSKRDVYSGQVRQVLLDQAAKAADAPRVVNFFKGFLTEAQATGNAPQPQPQNQPPAAPAPRQAAVPLEALAAPGRPKPATGADTPPTPADTAKIYTRAEIAKFYADVRAQRYAGREAEKNRIEAEIFAAQNAGRVR